MAEQMAEMDTLAQHLGDMLEWHALIGEDECFCGWKPAVLDAATYDDLADAIECEHRRHVAEHIAASLVGHVRPPTRPADHTPRAEQGGES